MPFKKFTSLIVLLLFSAISFAQQFTTHAVKKGETLSSIARQYKVSTANILTYNKEIKADGILKPNTILVIPVVKDTKSPEEGTTAQDVEEKIKEQEEPIGFTTHKVKKRETLIIIAKRYHIEEDDIKKYNKALYAKQVKKGMRLKIPKYRRVKPSEDKMVNEDDFETYTVMPKETRWSIANRYGITMDRLLELNPQLPKNSTYLAEGERLKLPKIKGSTITDQEIELYDSYTVPPKMTMFSLSQERNITQQQIVRLNPEITERGGLKEGMVIRLPKIKTDTGVVNTDNFIFYEVKPKENEFRLTRKLGMPYKDLIALNPDLKDGLKAGMVLKLPKDQVGDFEVKDALVLERISLLDSIDVAQRPKVVFMLPFRTDKLNMEDVSSYKKDMRRRNDIKLSLGLYTGALIAIDSIAAQGISVDVATYDNELNVTKTKQILQGQSLSDVSAIFGPLDTNSLKEVAVQAKNAQVPVIAPHSAGSDLSLSNVFFALPNADVLREKILTHVENNRQKENIVIIADSLHHPVRAKIMEKFADAQTLDVLEKEDNIAIDREKLTELLSDTEENWVFLETTNFKLVSSVVSILNSSRSREGKEIKIKLYTTNRNKAFENEVISSVHLSNLNFCYPSFYREGSNDAFKKAYRKRFGMAPDKFAIRGFDLTYDLLLKLAYKNDLVQISNMIGETRYSGHKFNFEKDATSGYFNKATFIMNYNNLRIKEVK